MLKTSYPEVLLVVVFQTPYITYMGLDTVYGMLHIYFVEREIPEETTEKERGKEDHLLGTGNI